MSSSKSVTRLAIEALTPQKLPTNAWNCSIGSLMASDLHLGHRPKDMHPNSLPYVYGQKQIHILNLEHTLQQLRRACSFLNELKKTEGKILWLGSKDCSIGMRMARITSTEFKSYQPGMFTNSKLKEFIQPDAVIFVPTFLQLYSENRFDVLKGPTKEVALLECMKACVPSISLCDSNEDIRMITYPIIGNDDGVASGQLISKILANSIKN
eukprot:NODE_65_length_25825_cov_1.353844.p13 type:complete len:211 gc:universal NODE_65_length_25825_cov_1.353844:19707-20339(+)